MIFDDLSPRLKEILNLLCFGCSDFEIMEKLVITRATLRNHLNVLYERYQIEGYNRKVRLILARIHEMKQTNF